MNQQVVRVDQVVLRLTELADALTAEPEYWGAIMYNALPPEDQAAFHARPGGKIRDLALAAATTVRVMSHQIPRLVALDTFEVST